MKAAHLCHRRAQHPAGADGQRDRFGPGQLRLDQVGGLHGDADAAARIRRDQRQPQPEAVLQLAPQIQTIGQRVIDSHLHHPGRHGLRNQALRGLARDTHFTGNLVLGQPPDPRQPGRANGLIQLVVFPAHARLRSIWWQRTTGVRDSI